jgi:hypothetical protein
MTASSLDSTFERLIESARRRLLFQLLSSQVLVALTIGAGALVLLLILGTQVLDWYWPVLLGLAAAAILVYRVWAKIPDHYRVAQLVDRRLETNDLFSTALHFNTQAATTLTPSLMAAANDAARASTPAAAMPLAMPKGVLPAVALFAIATSLFVYRYAFQSSLDLERPIAPGLFQLLASGEKAREVAKNGKKGEEALPLDGVGFDAAKQQRAEDQSIEKGQEMSTETAATQSSTAGQKPGQFQQAMTASEEGEKIDGAEKGDQSSEGSGSKESQDGQSGDKKDSSATAPDPKNAKSQSAANQQGEKSSLMDKFRDAMANMMNKMKSQDKNQGQQQQAKNDAQNQQQGAGDQKQSSQKGQQSQGQQQSGGQPQQDPNGQQQGEGQEKSQSQQAKGGDKSNQPSSGDQKAGMGKQDGSKNVELAQQQQAMGKISEIFGKRAQNIQGEMMIEVSSSRSQQLKTGYSNKQGAHSDNSGIIRRDEVPLIHQNYIRRYFEELRKSPPPATSSPQGGK